MVDKQSKEVLEAIETINLDLFPYFHVEWDDIQKQWEFKKIAPIFPTRSRAVTVDQILQWAKNVRGCPYD